MAKGSSNRLSEATRFFAHSENSAGLRHSLAEHLRGVAHKAETFSERTDWMLEARLAGLLHDLGKYADRFQARLRGEDSGLDHWSQGAWIALSRYKSIGAALAIQGHHVGLQRGSPEGLRSLDPAKLRHPFGLDLSDPDVLALENRALADGISISSPPTTVRSAGNAMTHAVAGMLDVRMLFSCLVDADFIDTEAHFSGDATGKRHRAEGPKLNASEALAALNGYMEKRVRSGTVADVAVLSARETLWRSCGKAAKSAPGTFTLTAPTGSGKTLAMLHFALEHAVRNPGLKRIVLAVPFLTVIEQTARIYREIFADFPEHFVLEHHSLAGLGNESEKQDAEGAQERGRRLLAENWDAPVVLTTNVQLLESLFSNRPSACRKLHNLMDSVVLFDEAQSLPQHLAVPTLAALSHLSAAYRSTVVFATATQPAFDAMDAAVKKYATGGWNPAEIVPEHPVLFANLKRVAVRWPSAGGRQSWAEVAEMVRREKQVLVILNLKRHALALLTELGSEDGVFHLSTNLCPEHRRSVLRMVRVRLMAGEPCRLISTQCVEAGVDVDFPKVFRAFAPLEAIAQAAGRCNREGRLNAGGQLGVVTVFEPEEEGGWRRCYPAYSYFQAAEVTRMLLVQRGDLDINDPEIFRTYYRMLYDLSNPESQNTELTEAIDSRDFVEIARLYRLIEKSAIQVLVPWQDRSDEFQLLRDEAENTGISAGWMRRAQGLAVSVYRPRSGLPAWAIPARLGRMWMSGVSDEWFILEGNYYDQTLGLNPPDGQQVFIA